MGDLGRSRFARCRLAFVTRVARRLLWCLPLLLGSMSSATEIEDAEVVLEVLSAATPSEVPEAAPVRFALLEDRQVFVGGTRQLLTARLQKRDVKPIEKLVNGVRKIKGLGASVTLGPGEERYRLWMRKGRPQQVTATGDPARAPKTLRRLADLLLTLSSYYHPALRPYQPTTYALQAREGRLAGGCRTWGLDLAPPGAAPPGARRVPAFAFAGWPSGSHPASVCAGGKTYIVTLRPLLPGERP
jgi:hypothetical protein